jgi:hypothetical protein
VFLHFIFLSKMDLLLLFLRALAFYKQTKTWSYKTMTVSPRGLWKIVILSPEIFLSKIDGA